MTTILDMCATRQLATTDVKILAAMAKEVFVSILMVTMGILIVIVTVERIITSVN
jgi:hypothetical protein